MQRNGMLNFMQLILILCFSESFRSMVFSFFFVFLFEINLIAAIYYSLFWTYWPLTFKVGSSFISYVVIILSP